MTSCLHLILYPSVKYSFFKYNFRAIPLTMEDTVTTKDSVTTKSPKFMGIHVNVQPLLDYYH